jgi:hypothetical protein
MKTAPSDTKLRHLSTCATLLCIFFAACSHVVGQECSTEKVNDNCTITINRSYPIAFPPIQLRPGKSATIKVVTGLPFEILSLDLQTGQAVVGTDQTAGFLSAALPNLKGLLISQQLNTGGAFGFVPPPAPQPSPEANPVQELRTSIDQEQTKLDKYLAAAKRFESGATIIYDQLNEVLGPIPPQVIESGRRLSSSRVGQDVPRPWIAQEYSSWVRLMDCEIAGQRCQSQSPPSAENCVAGSQQVWGILVCGTRLVSQLALCPAQTDQQKDLVACEIAQSESNLENLENLSAGDQAALSASIRRLKEAFAALTADAAAIANVDKDLSAYLINVDLSHAYECCSFVGAITDPRNSKRNSQLPNTLGRQVVYALNALNQVATSSASVAQTAQKKTVVPITIIYADPKFEVSAGILFSLLPQRSFSNQTVVAQNPGASPTLGDVVISESITRPTAVVFAGGNWRIGRDFLWFGSRRGAVYLTGAVGLNVNNTAAEFGVGPSISWRSLMFSTLYDWGHDQRLTQGEFVGEIWCNQSAASGNGLIPKCSGQPPSPSTEKYWRGAVAFGISVRIPTSFSGTGGTSH